MTDSAADVLNLNLQLARQTAANALEVAGLTVGAIKAVLRLPAEMRTNWLDGTGEIPRDLKRGEPISRSWRTTNASRALNLADAIERAVDDPSVSRERLVLLGVKIMAAVATLTSERVGTEHRNAANRANSRKAAGPRKLSGQLVAAAKRTGIGAAAFAKQLPHTDGNTRELHGLTIKALSGNRLAISGADGNRTTTQTIQRDSLRRMFAK